MHEHAFINTILNDIFRLASPEMKITNVNIEVGELVGIEPNHLKKHLEDNLDFNINLVSRQSVIECPCGFTGRATILERLHDKVIFACPWCTEPMGMMNIIEGDKIKILSIHYD